MANENDTRVIALRAQIEEKRSSLKSRTSRFSPITNCSIELSGVRHNINVLDRQSAILLGAQLQALEIGAEHLDLKPADLVISGFAVTDWITDIKAKLESLAVKEEETKLKALDRKLQELLSEEARTDIAIKEIESLLA